MMEASRVAEESGPDEDLLLRKPKILKVIDVDCPEVIRYRGVICVERMDPFIEIFLNDVPNLVKSNETQGLIWDHNLRPEQFKYEKGIHFLSTREADIKTNHSTVSFYRDGVTGTKFAIKTLGKGTHFHPEEIQVGLAIQDPNICSVYGIIIAKGLIHILLEHAGSPLYKECEWITQCPKRLQSFAKQSFRALDLIHSSGFVHCDIKPDNIVIDKHDCDEFTVKLIDFGTCYPQGTNLPTSARTTLMYWSPEMWQAIESKLEVTCTPAMDVYALALTLHYVHTSKHLMERFNKEAYKKLMLKTPDDILLIALPDTIPPNMSSVMRSCLCGDHKIRSSANEALTQLTECTLLRRWSASAEENYKDSFSKMYSSISKTSRHASFDTSNTAYKTPAVPQSLLHNSQEKGTCTSNSIGIDKREFKTVAKTKKTAGFSVNKFNKPLQKDKKCTRLQFKQKIQMVTQISPETFQKPLVSPDSDFEKSVELKPDEKDYTYSTLLKNLALSLQETHQMNNSCMYKSNSGIMQYAVADKSADIPVKLPGKLSETGYLSKLATTRPIDQSYKISGNILESEFQNHCPLQNKNEERVVKITGDTEKDLGINIISSSVSHSLVEPGSRLQDNGIRDCENIHDDMDFVFHAIDDNAFTGADDDIVDNMFAMLDKDEQTECSYSSKGSEISMTTHQVKSIKQDDVAVSTEEEPMEAAEHDESAALYKIDTRSDLSLVKGTRKRMAESSLNSSCIPGKAVFFPPNPQDTKMHQLPDFDQILP